jgi:hypothetical protein
MMTPAPDLAWNSSASTWRPSRNPLRAEGKTLKAWLRSPSEDACTAFAAS